MYIYTLLFPKPGTWKRTAPSRTDESHSLLQPLSFSVSYKRTHVRGGGVGRQVPRPGGPMTTSLRTSLNPDQAGHGSRPLGTKRWGS